MDNITNVAVVNTNNSHSPSQGRPPKELTDLNSWLTYRLETKPDGKLDKIPTDPHTGHNKARDAFGLSYDQVSKLAASSPRVHGIGLDLRPDDMLTCIDLDGCRDAETGQIKDWAWKIINLFKSYAEVSVSRTGVHIFVRGAVTGANVFEHEGHKVEMYSQDRFIAVTGDHIEGTPTNVQPGQRKLNIIAAEHPKAPTAAGYRGAGNGLDDADVLDRARAAANGEEFARLYDQGTSAPTVGTTAGQTWPW
jgi:putative DNA primase/helicase